MERSSSPHSRTGAASMSMPVVSIILFRKPIMQQASTTCSASCGLNMSRTASRSRMDTCNHTHALQTGRERKLGCCVRSRTHSKCVGEISEVAPKHAKKPTRSQCACVKASRR